MKTEFKTVYFTPEAHAQIKYYVDKSSVEISGLGRIKRLADGSMMVHKIYLLEQENGPASTDIDEEAMSKLLFESRMDEGDLNFWWHSHVNMGVFWSGTDMATIKQFGKNGYLLSTVFNKKGESRTSYMQGASGFLPEIFIDEIPAAVLPYQTSAEELKAWETEYETKAKAKVWTAPAVTRTHGGTTYHGNGRSYINGEWVNHYDMDDDDYMTAAQKQYDAWNKSRGANGIPTTPVVPKEPEFDEFIGMNSNQQSSDLIKAVKRFFYQTPILSYDTLSTHQLLQLADIVELSEDEMADEIEMKDTLLFIQASESNMKWICQRIREYGDRLNAEIEEADDEDVVPEDRAFQTRIPVKTGV